MTSLYLIGGGGHCKSCIDVIEQTKEFNIKGIFDTSEKVGKKVLGYEIIGEDKDLKNYLGSKDFFFLITIGQIKSSAAREKYFSMDLNFATIISPRAYVSKHATLGKGTIIMHDALVNAGAQIGDNCIVNTKALIEHDAKVGNHCHISTSSVVNGDCVIRDRTFVGSNAVLRNSLELEEGAIVPFGEKK